MCITLADAANAAEVVTAIVLGGAAAWAFLRARIRRITLERYLLKARLESRVPGGSGSGTRTIIRIMGDCAMTENEVLQAAFSSEKIVHWFTVDEKTHRADGIMFQYSEKGRAARTNATPN